MKLVPQDTPLTLPAICAICEASPQRDQGEQVVDTEYQTRQGQILAGRKYLCERCIEGAHLALNTVDTEHTPIAKLDVATGEPLNQLPPAGVTGDAQLKAKASALKKKADA